MCVSTFTQEVKLFSRFAREGFGAMADREPVGGPIRREMREHEQTWHIRKFDAVLAPI
jgi:hypothetical protein